MSLKSKVFVPKSGHCGLDYEGLNSIYNPVIDWAKNYPGCSIVFFGHSNGVRISLEMDVQLREEAPKSPLALFMIAGAAFGTPLIQVLNRAIKTEYLEVLTRKLITSAAFVW